MLPRDVRAQVGSTTDIITGKITSPDGKPIVGARVDAMSIETGVTRSRTTNDKGQYTILFPDGGGSYRMAIRYLGFAPVDLHARATSRRGSSRRGREARSRRGAARTRRRTQQRADGAGRPPGPWFS